MLLNNHRKGQESAWNSLIDYCQKKIRKMNKKLQERKSLLHQTMDSNMNCHQVRVLYETKLELQKEIYEQLNQVLAQETGEIRTKTVRRSHDRRKTLNNLFDSMDSNV